jgi:hypothetical protein
MGTLETAFAVLVTLLAAAAVIGALVFAVVWEVCAIRRTLAGHRRAQAEPPATYWRDHQAVAVPQRRP